MTESLEQEIQTLRSLFWSERDPDGRGFVPLADAYRRAGDVRQAMDLLSDGLARHPEFAPAHVVAARLYVEQGMVEEGEMAARRALDLDSENVFALGALLRVLEDGGRSGEATEVRDRLLAIDPGALDGDEATSTEAGVVESGGGVEAGALSIDTPAGEVDVPSTGTDAETDEAGSGLIDISGLTDFDLPEEGAPEAEQPVESGEGPASDFELSGVTLSEEGSEEETVVQGLEEVGGVEAVDVSSLAPDPEPAGLVDEADVADIAVLAPDPEPADEADVVDIGAFAPDPEPVGSADVADIAMLAPDPEPVDEVDVVDIGAFAPDPEPVGSADVADIAMLPPDPEPVDEADVVDIATLAPGPAGDDDALDVAMLAPDEETAAAEAPVVAASQQIDPSHDEDGERASGAPIYTRTLAELYVKQGFTDRALEVLRHLQRSAPGDESLTRRIEELEAGRTAGDESAPRLAAPRLPGGSEAAALVREADEEVETLARDLAESGERGHDVDTPFAWTEQEAEQPRGDQPSIREYFEGLLGWRSRGGS